MEPDIQPKRHTARQVKCSYLLTNRNQSCTVLAQAYTVENEVWIFRNISPVEADTYENAHDSVI